jgi:primosomal replication protein N''
VRSLGFEPITARDGDAFGLDFAIENPHTKLFGIGIECDAPRHPLLDRARAREIWRPSVLKRAIGTVHRVSSHAWFHRPNEERGRLSIAIQAAMNQGAHYERA